LRYFLKLAYNGRDYHGWQYQPNAVTVQETLEKALSTILQEKTPVVGCGRTDTGVHASQYFAHFDAQEITDFDIFLYKINAVLPADVAVYKILKVHPEAHARFDAISRSYQYHIIQHKDPFLNETAYRVKNELNVEAMNNAAAILKDYKDFKCFSRSKTDVKTYNCVIAAAFWERKENRLVFTITADRFLRNMVRAIVGTLLETGLEKIPVSHMHTIINSRNRQYAGTSVPARALFLTGIEYPQSIFIK
jgi:tRNA pseudouridine38-40 synthase